MPPRHWKALALAGAGLVLTFAAPLHRLDLLLIGLAALIGGVALVAYGLSRTTLDLDFALDAASQEDVVQFLESLGYETVHRTTGLNFLITIGTAATARTISPARPGGITTLPIK